MTDLPGVTVAAAIDRGDHVRVILGSGQATGSRDLPLDPAQRAAFLDALRAAGVPVRVTRRPCKIPRGGA